MTDERKRAERRVGWARMWARAKQIVTTDSEPPKVLSVTASFGIASYPESKAADGEDLVRRADRALYRAKKTGKNRVELYWADKPSEAAVPGSAGTGGAGSGGGSGSGSGSVAGGGAGSGAGATGAGGKAAAGEAGKAAG